jgi:protein-tyrosine phosphatase
MSSPTPYQVLCVCLGNICRSPTAEVVLRQHCEVEKLNINIDSAGTSSHHFGKAPDLRSQQHAQLRGYDLSKLRARQIQVADFITFDLILAMDHDNLRDIQMLANEAKQQFGYIRAQIALMSSYDPLYLNQALPDPYYGGETGFERVLDQCESSSRGWVAHFQQQNSQV